MKEGALRKMARAIAFGRNVPLAKLARRLELDLIRRVAHVGLSAPLPATAPPLADRPPTPLFEPRRGMIARIGRSLRFTFLRQSHASPAIVDWRMRRGDRGGQLWRMNLHYMEYLEDVDDEMFFELVSQWTNANPPYARDYWKDTWNSYALSLRVVVWMQQAATRGARLTVDESAMMIASLARQLRFLEANLETDIGGNHLIKNLKALIWASAFFTGRDADRWRACGLRLLRRELRAQILPDGMHYERSPSYHCQVFADLLECRHALGCDPLNGELDDALHHMAQVVADLTHPDGSVALFNDSGLSMAYAPGECLAVYEKLFGGRPSSRDVFAFRDAGYFGLRSEESYFLADCGRIGPDDLPAHAHGDVASFEWSVGGARIVVDQGVFEYVAGERRELCRTAASHNTLCFDGADQAEFFGSFRCGRRPEVAILSYSRTDDGFMLTGEHDGFARLAQAPIHIRGFAVEPSRITITDRIEGHTKRVASIGFLLHPDAQVEIAGAVASITRGAVAIRMSCSRPIEIEPAVWWPDMGLEFDTTRLRVKLDGEDGVTTELSVVSYSADE
ncbi:putative heparinase superfamily protein [Methylosinus sp. sav-2]|jgi:uncharacterized heparinase superfamily protein|nr:putative heparinase superfamily protein [Methylosinus sp. sav-2]